MTQLREETLEMPAGDLGPESPLPPLHSPAGPVGKMRIDASVPRSDRKYMQYGGPTPLLPYHMQDEYGRRKRTRAFRTAVLENEILRATFLLELGGRLWSLVHKPTGRELLYVNPVFQAANLATRNAWFSGGVEWNIGLRGHSPLTCSPLFAAEVIRRDGTPVLRLYEWERVRGVPFQIDACLPSGSAFLLVHVRIVNPHDREIPMYWWSNMAVPEAPGLRVLTPADSALRTDYAGRLSLQPVPPPGGPDVTYPANVTDAADFFYRVPHLQRPWIAALDNDGRGLVQTSTRRLKGRKLFVWGMGAGGRRWQEFLSVPDRPYVEIQAGLARTQREYVPMPAGAQWSWVEAYGLMEADPGQVHDKDCPAARRVVDARLDEILSEKALRSQHSRMRTIADSVPLRLIQSGSGWGALECKRRQMSSEPPMCTGGTVFDPRSLGEDQRPWLELLERGELPPRDPAEGPGKSLVQEEWRRLLEEAVRTGRSDHWLAWLHLGTMRFAAGDVEGAHQAWETSLERQPTAWALRNLAALARQEGRAEEACHLYGRALGMAPDLAPLAIECFATLLRAGKPRDVLSLIEQSPPRVRNRSRVRLLLAQAALAAGDLDQAERTLGGLEVVDIREGDNITTELWFQVHERRLAERENVPIDDALRQRVRREFPPPRDLDYRMFRQSK